MTLALIIIVALGFVLLLGSNAAPPASHTYIVVPIDATAPSGGGCAPIVLGVALVILIAALLRL